jgi:hypothetical protein
MGNGSRRTRHYVSIDLGELSVKTKDRRLDPNGMDLNQKLWLLTGAVGIIRSLQGYWKISLPLTTFCFIIFLRKSTPS